MSESTFSVRNVEGNLSAAGLKIAVIAGRFNSFVVEQLVLGALDCVKRHGGSSATVVRVPGAWEIPLVAEALARQGQFDAIVALGAVIRGSTPHFDFVAGEAAKGLAAVMRETGVPIAFGVITTDTIEQAIERAGTKMGNKGWEATASAIETAQVLRSLKATP
ncbi:MAG: 6,7-dimethyl-8-ribityllumazine synthase [Deltaproteobacteria bacterium]|nr:6,7-dimethyl-8-ribityllumazine synthase [Deltaproteobacteria bacterium]